MYFILIYLAIETLNIDITLSMIEVMKTTHEKWSESFRETVRNSDKFIQKQLEMSDGKSSNHLIKNQETIGCRRRTPFYPFSLENKTGSELFYRCCTSDRYDLF